MKRRHFLRIVILFTLLLVHTFLGHLSARPPGWPEDNILVLPDMGSSPIISAIRSAKKSIDLMLYHLDDTQIIDQLIHAKKERVSVRVILHKPDLYPAPFENRINTETVEKLTHHGIQTHFLPDHMYTLTHSKFMIIDEEYAIIQTFNYDDFNFQEARNFGILVDNKDQVQSLAHLFNNDYNSQPHLNDDNISHLRTSNIILGPVHQREYVKEFLQSAHHSIYIYQQDLSDPEVGETLISLSKKGIKVHVLMTPVPFGGIDNNRINHTKIMAFGGKCRFKPKADLYIHAKVVLIDPESEGQMYLGSCNFWPEALSNNRELGLIVQNKNSIQSVFDVFKRDWESAQSYSQALESSKK
jgi:phosphatidylserine/phosphatidylglycerophosphate/cardiolipin synthase-like enzyme